ncbi:LOW QUALITY PROTEIN: polyphosphoinositide phosphatase-like [Amphiura filiformis]|uniref:LOW QUALITY PROTEIN: polyphosphoinositide phosphatase-like n=1 Tax=Amphiura filiformis TaxID=82378 RepID=UPI003B20C92C
MALPVICNLQKIVLYETKARCYIVGSNYSEERFRVLKIDRTEPIELAINDDKIEYSRREVQDLLRTLEQGNRTKQTKQKYAPGLSRTVSAFGIVGFVRFLEGYYIILITKRRRVAIIGGHTIYKIEDTSMVYIPNDECTGKVPHPDESRYVKIFQNVDLSSNFYFSYSYDLSNSLQYNLTPAKVPEEESKDGSSHGKILATRLQPSQQFTWNEYLWSKARHEVHPDWVTYVTHGFVGQHNVCVFGRPVYMTLIARRSSQFAGTRFLKRGSNSKGHVANEIETEQIVHDASLTTFKRGRYTSYVQMRGSVPGSWSQDISNMVPKPPITLDLADPYASLPGAHFNNVLARFGSPIVILNLVKTRERRKREAFLTGELITAIKYLNQFLPPKHEMKYIGLDMARYTKSAKLNVITKLDSIAANTVKQTGIFLSGACIQPSLPIKEGTRFDGPEDNKSAFHYKQTGVVRTNCVDCLDRTNTAQFVVGKYALAHQLYCIGVIDKPNVEFDTDTIRMLEDLYEDMGDTLALQYGGSQLVHSIQTYRKLSPWTSHSRDIKQTLSRYYSNAFSDADKQSAMNLFLGVFQPIAGRPNMWDLHTDYYLHHTEAQGLEMESTRRSYTQWFDDDVINALPLPAAEVTKAACGDVIVRVSPGDEVVDPFIDYYRPCELTSLLEMFCSNMPHSIRTFMPKSTSDYSPFKVRIQQSKRKEEASSGELRPTLPIAGRLVTAGSPKTSENTSSSDDTSSDTSDMEGSSFDNSMAVSSATQFNMKDAFPTTKDIYGVEFKDPERKDTMIYQRYVSVGVNAKQNCMEKTSETGKIKICNKKATRLIPHSVFNLDSSYEVTPPTVDRNSKATYENYVQGLIGGSTRLKRDDLSIYRAYMRQKSK